MVNPKIIQEWFKAAEKDLKVAREDVDKKDRFEDVGFHCQQAAEKFLKSYIVAFELSFQKIHDLETLLEICIEKDSSFSELRTQCRLLTPFYIPSRYPDFEDETKLKSKNIKDALKYAEKIAYFVKSKLP